ncbi:MAG TPA: hypothetical protein VGE91_00935 [Solirubrobacterales bacterium]
MLAALVLAASSASAMGQAALDQYLPSANPAGHHGGARSAVQEARGSTTTTPGTESPPAKARKSKLAGAVGSPGGPSGSDDGGYPLTAFVIIVLILFLLGIAARYLPRLVRRLQSRPIS